MKQDKIYKYNIYYERLKAGSKWIAKKKRELEKDIKELERNVELPMQDIWNTFTEEEKETWYDNHQEDFPDQDQDDAPF